MCGLYGKTLKILHQFCYDHGIHNAVVKVLYKKAPKDDSKTVQVDEDEGEADERDPDDPESDYDDDDADVVLNESAGVDIDSDDETVEDEISDAAAVNDEIGDADDDEEFRLDYGKNIKLVREICKLFRKSPKLNDILQETIVAEHGRKLQLQLDVRTRWHSLLIMLNTFSRVSGSIKRVLGDINRLELWSNEIPLAIDELASVLKIAKMAMDEISKDDANLLTAEGALEFLFQELEEINSTLSLELLEEIKVMLHGKLNGKGVKRRPKSLVSLMKFLQNPKSIKEDKKSFFASTSKADVVTLATEIWKKNFTKQLGENSEESDEDDKVQDLPATSMKERLGMAIGKRTATQQSSPSTISSEADHTIKLACESYASTNVMHPCLKQILDALLLIKPTSIKNEQNFSMSSNFLSKNRKQMSACTLDDLCLLKSHFCSLQNKK